MAAHPYVPVVSFWLTEDDTFVYRRIIRGHRQFMLFDAAAGEKGLAFDHVRRARKPTS
ncbi:hypothetical protein [Mesorhizobium sp. M1A.F.Ca.ET.072.01.1.1]|uniref:hypothetical protein n=1 Tax=Mesorhizobium sp. M1A.F.Ca.ET.072.01.1.1 TaxID=2496753 RepID=UPI00167C2217|nr:hypothetical protein [Mesorhizobium sp. M1A.F.Ca.ET.072.01.1.1]